MFFYFFDKTYQMKRKRRNLMKDYLQECVQKLSLSVIDETVDAEPKVEASQEEIKNVLNDLYVAVDNSEYIPQTPTEENPALSDDFIFDTKDQNFVLKGLLSRSLLRNQ